MGSAICCEKCTTSATGTVVNLSDALILRIVEGVEEPPSKTKKIGEGADSDWIAKIKCLDDAHTQAYGLSIKDLESSMLRVEAVLRKGTMPVYCPPDTILGCYRFNSKCSLKCAKEVSAFVDCLDAQRLQRLKAMVERERRKIEKAKAKKKRK